MAERCLAEVITATRLSDGQAHHVFEQSDLVFGPNEGDGMSRQMVACRVCTLLCEVNFDDEFDGQLYPSDYLDNLHRRECGLANPAAEVDDPSRRAPFSFSLMAFGFFQ